MLKSVIFCFVIWKVFCYNITLQTSVLLSVKQITVLFLNTQNDTYVTFNISNHELKACTPALLPHDGRGTQHL